MNQRWPEGRYADPAIAVAFVALFTIVLTTRLVTGKGVRPSLRTA
ncbi:hypothetical protein ACH4KU_30385 [Streptomyces althioticus]